MMNSVIWTAIIQNSLTGKVRTPVVQASYSGREAMEYVKDNYLSDGPDGEESLVCLVRGAQAQGVYPNSQTVD